MTGSPPPGRRWQIVAAAVGVVLVGLVVLEVGGRVIAARVAASELADVGVPEATVVTGSRWWRPTMLTALVGGSVDRVHVELSDAEVSGLRVAHADYVLEDLEVDANPFGGRLSVKAIGNGSFQVLLAPESVGEQLGVPARILEGRLVVGPDDEPAKVRVEDGELLVESRYLAREGIDPRLGRLDQRLLPCAPQVTVAGAMIELSCRGDRLPGVLDTSLGEPVGDVPAPSELEPPKVIERDTEGSPTAAGGSTGGSGGGG